MGKEAKIGLGVIAGLFVVLGGVISMRVASLGRDPGLDFGDDASEAAAADAGSVQPAVLPAAMASAGGGSTGGSANPKPEPAKRPEPEIARKPTVLSPETPEPSAGAEPKWRELAAQGGAATASDDPYAGAAPSYMPSPPRPVPDVPAGPYGNAYATPPDVAGYASAGAGDAGGPHYDPRAGSRFDAPGAARPPDARAAPYPPNPAGGTHGAYPAATRSVSDTRPSLGTGSSGGLRGDGTYEIQPNDSFWKISEKLYGTGAYFRALAEHNHKKVANQNSLQVGQIIATPDVAELEQKYPAYCPKPEHRYVARHHTTSLRVGRQGEASYTVAEGDSLYRIARYELGDASRWYEIYQINREVIGESYNHLRPGTELILPNRHGSEPADAVTRRPGSLY